jgi:2-iminobutanoate/2-iminopropanoate deaminase
VEGTGCLPPTRNGCICGTPFKTGGCDEFARSDTHTTETPTPIGPYNHVAKVGEHSSIGRTAGLDPATGQLAGADVAARTTKILKSFSMMPQAVGSDLDHVVHINIFLKSMADFDAMNAAYETGMGDHRPARTVVAVVAELPKPGVRLTMNLTAVTQE